jgi:hypothetical protein
MEVRGVPQRRKEHPPVLIRLGPRHRLRAAVAAVLRVDRVPGQQWVAVPLQRIDGVEPARHRLRWIHAVQDGVLAGLLGARRGQVAVVPRPPRPENAQREGVIFRLVRVPRRVLQ